MLEEVRQGRWAGPYEFKILYNSEYLVRKKFERVTIKTYLHRQSIAYEERTEEQMLILHNWQNLLCHQELKA